MTELPTPFPELKLFRLDVHADPRGRFMETYRRSAYVTAGVTTEFVQDNLSISTRGTLRGLHYQLRAPQAKLVQVLSGEVYDVVVDIRVGSPTFGRWHGQTLSAENALQLYIPAGFAHGFCVRSDTAAFVYKVGAEYAPDDEYAIAWNDATLAIPWGEAAPLLSARDAAARPLGEMTAFLPRLG